MPRISQTKKDKISEQILHYLFTVSPNPKFTSEIAKEIARDEEFVKVLLQDLKLKKIVSEVNKNAEGNVYSKRKRWLLTSEVFQAYQKHQTKRFL
ncbi:MAG: hypothetical protein AABX66_03930 [Nanoarchaeota archaeon]